MTDKNGLSVRRLRHFKPTNRRFLGSLAAVFAAASGGFVAVDASAAARPSAVCELDRANSALLAPTNTTTTTTTSTAPTATVASSPATCVQPPDVGTVLTQAGVTTPTVAVPDPVIGECETTDVGCREQFLVQQLETADPTSLVSTEPPDIYQVDGGSFVSTGDVGDSGVGVGLPNTFLTVSPSNVLGLLGPVAAEDGGMYVSPSSGESYAFVQKGFDTLLTVQRLSLLSPDAFDFRVRDGQDHLAKGQGSTVLLDDPKGNPVARFSDPSVRTAGGRSVTATVEMISANTIALRTSNVTASDLPLELSTLVTPASKPPPEPSDPPRSKYCDGYFPTSTAAIASAYVSTNIYDGVVWQIYLEPSVFAPATQTYAVGYQWINNKRVGQVYGLDSLGDPKVYPVTYGFHSSLNTFTFLGSSQYQDTKLNDKYTLDMQFASTVAEDEDQDVFRATEIRNCKIGFGP
jgi:hypothetical protein